MTKANDDLVLLIKSRIAEHEAAEKKKAEERAEAERERIRKEEADRLEREAEQKRQDEAKAQAVAAPAAAPAVAEPRYESRHIPEAKATTSASCITRATVTSKLELLKAVLSGEVPDAVLVVDMDALDALCNTLGRPVPGTAWGKA